MGPPAKNCGGATDANRRFCDNAVAYAISSIQTGTAYGSYSYLCSPKVLRPLFRSGYGLGSMLAVVCSWQRNRSILWAILAGFLTWFYVIYFALTRAAGRSEVVSTLPPVGHVT